jgi:phosphatidylglycerophosphatase A
MTELFWTAFDFINDWAHWYAITSLANYMLSNDSHIIGYDEVVTVLDTHFAVAKKSSWYSSIIEA